MTPELRAQLARGPETDHEEVIKLCISALRSSKNDPEILQVKAVGLLKLDRYDEALTVFEGSGDHLRGKAALEYAYALYKCGQLEKARKVAKSLGTRAAKHLEAQAVRTAQTLP